MVNDRRTVAGDKGFVVLKGLKKHKKLATGEVHKLVKHSTTGARILNVLKRLGYVSRIKTHERHPRVLWKLTEAGKRAHSFFNDLERRSRKKPEVKRK